MVDVCIRDCRGAGFTRGAVRGGHLHISAVRAYYIDCGEGAGPRAVSYCGPLRACIAYMRSTNV